ncbi:TIR-like protein FxsC [Streptomyces sp. NPDC050508]|uniref:TIR-like protein FxsC n=1 Tax=Streptomyces sp. NPDC050508 TaxID=3155405 RepID=UPI00343DE522
MHERVPDNRPHFFLSYAHTPPWGPDSGDPDHWVHVLYRDLCSHIMALTDLPAGSTVGFMDREMRSGEGWPEKLSENLATCRVFVPLFSPRYFSSEMCGREWFAFTERILHAKAAGATSVSAIVPALWTRVETTDLPDSVRRIHMEQLGASNGIYGLIKLNRRRDEYEEAVYGLAERIVQVARESRLPLGRPRDYESTPSAFKPRGAGPRHIRLTVAAPTRDTVPEYRDRTRYGEDALDWNPYSAESRRPLPALAEDLIRALDYRVSVASFDDEDTGDQSSALSPEATGAQEPEDGQPGILLVDLWALTDEERRRRLKTFDASSPAWVSAIVPRDRADPQCFVDEGQGLADELERTMPTILDRARRSDCRIAVAGVPTLKTFTNVLPGVVAYTTRKFLRQAEPRLPEIPHVPRERLMDTDQEPGSDAGDGDRGEA